MTKTLRGIALWLIGIASLKRTAAGGKFRKRDSLSSQKYICIPHYNLIMSHVPSKLPKPDQKPFIEATDKLVENYIKELNSDVNDFCNSFDYRNAGKLHSEEMEHVRNSIERAIEFLTSRKPDVK